MAIRIQQYNTGPRRIGVGGIDPGYQQPRIGNIAATAENQLAGTVLEAGKALTNVAIKEYVSTETTRVSSSSLPCRKSFPPNVIATWRRIRGRTPLKRASTSRSSQGRRLKSIFRRAESPVALPRCSTSRLRARRCTLPNRGRRTGGNRRPFGKSPITREMEENLCYLAELQ